MEPPLIGSLFDSNQSTFPLPPSPPYPPTAATTTTTTTTTNEKEKNHPDGLKLGQL